MEMMLRMCRWNLHSCRPTKAVRLLQLALRWVHVWIFWCCNVLMSRHRTRPPATCVVLAMALATMLSAPGQSLRAGDEDQTKFRRIQTQFIVALGDPDASSGNGAQTWGLWHRDPGPRGVWLGSYKQLKASNGIAPAQWKFDHADWWLDENGLIMEKPDFPAPPGKYVVTGDRETIAVLTIHPADEHGDRRWELTNGATLYDVTHLPCRSARYTPATAGESCSPANVRRAAFPVDPGGSMPVVKGCNKREYAVLFVIGVAVKD